METYKMGIDPYEPESHNESSAGVIITDGDKFVASYTSKSAIVKEFCFKAKLAYFLYFKRVALWDETTNKITKPKRLMTFRLKRKNPGKTPKE